MVQIKSLAPQDVKVILIGNKIDLENERQVSTEEGKALAEQYNLSFFETSAKSGYNVNEAFFTMGELVIEKATKNTATEPERTNQNINAEQLSKKKKSKKPKCCQ